ncbi:MAG: GNAT family N-acetyltransferase [Nitrososphaerota archaeon]|nr:GNAT family N-acetyltransferase [Nitrososphaerota archaeon]
MIRGEKVDLVAVSPDYLELYHRWINDPEVSEMLGVNRLPASMADEREWLEGAQDPSKEGRTFTILTKQGRPIGNIGFNHLTYRNRHGTIGIMIWEKDLWDKGYGTDAIMTLLRFGFEELGLVRVELNVDSLNERAIACYRKCGFVLEGRARKHTYIKASYHDDLSMGILLEEWRALTRKRKKRN